MNKPIVKVGIIAKIVYFPELENDYGEFTMRVHSEEFAKRKTLLWLVVGVARDIVDIAPFTNPTRLQAEYEI